MNKSSKFLFSLNQKTVFFLDIDGTLLIGDKIIDGVSNFLMQLKARNKQIFILTNNSSMTPDEHFYRLKKCGLLVDKQNVLVSIQSALDHLKTNHLTNVFWCASKKVSEFIESEGLNYDEKNPHAVLLTYDTEINYAKLVKITKLLRTGIPYFATHPDMLCPHPEGALPDIGCFIQLIHHATQRKPDRIFGKPHTALIDLQLTKLGKTKEDAVMIGDRLYTDIQMAINAGISSILVTTGETTSEAYINSDIKADLILDNLSLINLWL